MLSCLLVYLTHSLRPVSLQQQGIMERYSFEVVFLMSPHQLQTFVDVHSIGIVENAGNCSDVGIFITTDTMTLV